MINLSLGIFKRGQEKSVCEYSGTLCWNTLRTLPSLSTVIERTLIISDLSRQGGNVSSGGKGQSMLGIIGLEYSGEYVD